MDNELRKLKESMDETVLKEIGMTNSLKKKIMKKGSSRSFQSLPKIKFISSLAAAGLILLVLGYSFFQVPLEKEGHQADQPKMAIRNQQIALIHWQDQVVGILELQREAENNFLAEDLNGKDLKKLDLYRKQVIASGVDTINQLKQVQIPDELAPYSKEIQTSIQTLIHSYDEKNKYYQELNLAEFSTLDLDSFYLYSQNYMRTFNDFEQKIGDVYQDLGLGVPNFTSLADLYRLNKLSE